MINIEISLIPCAKEFKVLKDSSYDFELFLAEEKMFTVVSFFQNILLLFQGQIAIIICLSNIWYPCLYMLSILTSLKLCSILYQTTKF